MTNKYPVGLRKAEQIADIEMRTAYVSYVEYIQQTYDFKNKSTKDHWKRKLSDLRQSIEKTNLRNFNWGFIQGLNSMDGYAKSHDTNTTNINLLFMDYLIQNGLYYGNYKDEFINNRENILKFAHFNFKKLDKPLSQKGITPYSIIICETSFASKNQQIAVFINYKHKGLVDTIRRYLTEESIFSFIEKTPYINMFEMILESMEDKYELYDVNSFSDDTFFQSFNYLNNKINRKGLTALINFYLWVLKNIDDNAKLNNFRLLRETTLKYLFLLPRLEDGFRLVNYNTYEDPPIYPKMLLTPTSSYMVGASQIDRVAVLNISEINNIVLQKFYIEFYWKEQSCNFFLRHKSYSPLRNFLKILDCKYKGNKTEIEISAHDINEFQSIYLSQNLANSTIAKKYLVIKHFLDFLEKNKYVRIEPLLYRMLIHKDNEKNSYKEAYTKDEIQRLKCALEKAYKDEQGQIINSLYQIYYYVFLIMTASEIRLSSIMYLQVNCIQQTLSQKGRSEYKVLINSKTDDGEMEEINITNYVKKIIDEVVAATKEIREMAGSPEKSMLFIYLRIGKKAISSIRFDQFTTYIKRVCKEHNIDYKRSAGIRNYYMQTVSNYISKTGKNATLIPILTHHSSKVHAASYDKVNMIDFCQKYYHVEIGNVYLTGQISNNSVFDDESKVVNGCGFCSQKHCIKQGKLDCFMCSSFVTTISCIPYYESEIEALDKQLMNEKISHEKDFLLSKKKLLVGYLSQLMGLKGEVNVE